MCGDPFVWLMLVVAVGLVSIAAVTITALIVAYKGDKLDSGRGS